MVYLDRKRNYEVLDGEYNRVSVLELISVEIYENKVSGAVAELGVWRGDFAKVINEAFPDNKIFLFDTFEGFSQKDVMTEIEAKLSSGDQNFANTSEALVLSKLPHKKQAVVRKGWSPDSASDIDEKFCFVSLDAALYEPIKSCLEFF